MPLQLVNCGLSDETIRALEKRNIRSLFPIQKHVFEPAQAGRDLIGRARTGSGKTLAFALPVIENLLQVTAMLSCCFSMTNPNYLSRFQPSLRWLAGSPEVQLASVSENFRCCQADPDSRTPYKMVLQSYEGNLWGAFEPALTSC